MNKLVTAQGLGEYGTFAMNVYADEVNLSRAIPDVFDGLKPVQRRILWAAAQEPKGEFIKTARLSGAVIGRLHPHSDSSVNDAIETIVNSATPTIRGRGNWGGLMDRAAAARYTNCTLSSYGRTFFEPNHIAKAVTQFVPNYDDTWVEPVTLPAFFPHVLLTGAEGIGYRTTTCLPTFTPESVYAVLEAILKDGDKSPKTMARLLKFGYRYGGHVLRTKENRAGYLDMFTSGQGRVQFAADLVADFGKRTIEVNDWPPGLRPDRFILKVRDLPEVDHAFNHKGATGVRIEVKRGFNVQQFEQIVAKIKRMTIVSMNYKLNVTSRTSKVVDGVVTMNTEYLSLSIPQIFKTWLIRRFALEKASLTYRIGILEEQIKYSKLLIYATTVLDKIIAVVKAHRDGGRADLDKKVGRAIKVTVEQAHQITELKLYQLTALDRAAIENKLVEQEKLLAWLNKTLANPRAKILADAKTALEAVIEDRRFEQAKEQKVKVV